MHVPLQWHSEEAMHAHEQIIQRLFKVVLSQISLSKVVLLTFMSNVRCMKYAWRVFNKFPLCNVISYTAMLRGFAMDEPGKEALQHFLTDMSEKCRAKSCHFCTCKVKSKDHNFV
jgi:bacteriorhodopsin